MVSELELELGRQQAALERLTKEVASSTKPLLGLEAATGVDPGGDLMISRVAEVESRLASISDTVSITLAESRSGLSEAGAIAQSALEAALRAEASASQAIAASAEAAASASSAMAAAEAPPSNATLDAEELQALRSRVDELEARGSRSESEDRTASAITTAAEEAAAAAMMDAKITALSLELGRRLEEVTASIAESSRGQAEALGLRMAVVEERSRASSEVVVALEKAIASPRSSLPHPPMAGDVTLPPALVSSLDEEEASLRTGINEALAAASAATAAAESLRGELRSEIAALSAAVIVSDMTSKEFQAAGSGQGELQIEQLMRSPAPLLSDLEPRVTALEAMVRELERGFVSPSLAPISSPHGATDGIAAASPSSTVQQSHAVLLPDDLAARLDQIDRELQDQRQRLLQAQILEQCTSASPSPVGPDGDSAGASGRVFSPTESTTTVGMGATSLPSIHSSELLLLSGQLAALRDDVARRLAEAERKQLHFQEQLQLRPMGGHEALVAGWEDEMKRQVEGLTQKVQAVLQQQLQQQQAVSGTGHLIPAPVADGAGGDGKAGGGPKPLPVLVIPPMDSPFGAASQQQRRLGSEVIPEPGPTAGPPDAFNVVQKQLQQQIIDCESKIRDLTSRLTTLGEELRSEILAARVAAVAAKPVDSGNGAQAGADIGQDVHEEVLSRLEERMQLSLDGERQDHQQQLQQLQQLMEQEIAGLEERLRLHVLEGFENLETHQRQMLQEEGGHRQQLLPESLSHTQQVGAGGSIDPSPIDAAVEWRLREGGLPSAVLVEIEALTKRLEAQHQQQLQQLQQQGEQRRDLEDLESRMRALVAESSSAAVALAAQAQGTSLAAAVREGKGAASASASEVDKSFIALEVRRGLEERLTAIR